MVTIESLKIILGRQDVDNKLAEAFIKAFSAYQRSKGR